MKTFETRWFLEMTNPMVTILQEHIDNSIHRCKNRVDLYSVSPNTNTAIIIRNNKKLIQKTYEPFEAFQIDDNIAGESYKCIKHTSALDGREVFTHGYKVEKERKIIDIHDYGHIEFTHIVIDDTHEYMTLGIEIAAEKGYACFLEQTEFFFEGIDNLQLPAKACHSYNEFIQNLYSL